MIGILTRCLELKLEMSSIFYLKRKLRKTWKTILWYISTFFHTYMSYNKTLTDKKKTKYFFVLEIGFISTDHKENFKQNS